VVTGNSGGAARSIDEILGEARARLRRVGPAEARAAMAAGAVLVDIRSQAQRTGQGVVPGALHIERNVLEWRFDPRSPARLPQASYRLRVIVMCVEGYTSSLAAASLQDLGVAGATDLAGGFRAWQRAGLPVVPGPVAPGTVPAGPVVPGAVVPGSVIAGTVVPGSVRPGSVVPGAVVAGPVVPSPVVPG
jgi:rhodanese-related sulfurtransferase